MFFLTNLRAYANAPTLLSDCCTFVVLVETACLRSEGVCSGVWVLKNWNGCRVVFFSCVRWFSLSTWLIFKGCQGILESFWVSFAGALGASWGVFCMSLRLLDRLVDFLAVSRRVGSGLEASLEASWKHCGSVLVRLQRVGSALQGYVSVIGHFE